MSAAKRAPDSSQVNESACLHAAFPIASRRARSSQQLPDQGDEVVLVRGDQPRFAVDERLRDASGTGEGNGRCASRASLHNGQSPPLLQ